MFFHIDYWNDYYPSTTSNPIMSSTMKRSFGTFSLATSHEWNGEFIAGQDSDQILIVQNDAVLCHPLDVNLWKEYAYVGAPWNLHHIQYYSRMPLSWRFWHSEASNNNSKIDEIPSYPSDTCHNPDHGGLSIQSRYWMREAIRYCPQVKYSGLNEDEIKQASCVISHIMGNEQEDYYYATILRGLFHNRHNGTTEYKNAIRL
jgi:Protein of unknown function (DUF5672)